MPEAKETEVDWLLTVAVVGAIAAVAYADSLVETISLGYLYVLPLSLSAMVHRLRTTMLLLVVCVLLHDWLGPFEPTFGWTMVARHLLTLVGFSTAVLVVHQLTVKRRELAEVVRVQRDQLAREIQLAAEVQQRLLPRQAPQMPGYEVAGQMQAARTIGGDYYDFIQLSDGDLGLVVADVSGKGVAAALLMPSVEMALRLGAERAAKPPELVATLNQHFLEFTDAARYVTLFYAKLHAAERVLEYTNAGHLPPLLVRSNGSEMWLEGGGTVVGLISEAEYTSRSVLLLPGDVLVLYTDGLTEAENPAGKEFSRRRLLSCVQQDRMRSAEEILTGLHGSVAEFVGAGQLSDDLTLVVLKVTGQ